MQQVTNPTEEPKRCEGSGGPMYTVGDVVPVTAADMDEIKSWWTQRDKTPPPDDWFSSVGLWVPHVCALWFYGTEGSKAYVDETISNPGVVGHSRSSAIIALGVALEDTAKRLGYRYLVGLTQLESMAMRMEVSGWRRAGQHHIFVKDVEAI